MHSFSFPFEKTNYQEGPSCSLKKNDVMHACAFGRAMFHGIQWTLVHCQHVRLADSFRCWFVKKYCWLVYVREKYCSGVSDALRLSKAYCAFLVQTNMSTFLRSL